MLNRRLTRWAAIALIAILALSGCAPRAGQGSVDADSDQLVVDLPALVLDISEDGVASIENAALSDLVATLGMPLDFGVPPAMVFFMIEADIQHIQVSNTPEGLLLLVNGQSVPSISYDGESLSALPETLSQFGLAIPMADMLMDLVDKLGVGVIARFPNVYGMEEIPLYVEGDSDAAMVAQASQEEFLSAVGEPPRINLPIFYELDGSFSIGDMSASEWAALTGGAIDVLSLTPADIGLAAGLGISELAISTNMDGITISINGNPLPTLDWSDGKASNLLDVLANMPLLDMVMGGMGPILPTINQVLPIVQTAEIDLTLHFHIPDHH